MAAYASLVSLMNNLSQIKNHDNFSTFVDYQIESLGQKIDFFLDFVESYDPNGGASNQETEEIESLITSAANEAEDVIESHIVELILHGSAEKILHTTRLQKVLKDMESIEEKVREVTKERKFNDLKPTNLIPSALSTSHTAGKISMVGFDDELLELKDLLTGQRSSRRIISIVGMGGSGKTTLARNVYESSLILQRFDIRAWATISQNYNVKEILLQLLSFNNGTVDELGEKLHKWLFGRRYLIILDDMWSIEVWDNIKTFFPDNGNGSRVVLTTRLSNVAAHVCSFCIRINLLEENECWNLFCQKVFGQEDCPPELVDIGKEIVEQCKGLPLSIVVIGGLLQKSLGKEYWQNVAKDIHSALYSTENGECLNVLYLSYSHLPAHLKPFFIYIGVFGEDCEISVSDIINLWVAEGFLKPNGIHFLEEIAEHHLKDLIDRNLIFVCEHRLNGNIRSFRVHDLVRELCLKVAAKEKLFRVVNAHTIPQGIDRERRLTFQDEALDEQVLKALQSAPLARSLICKTVAKVPVKRILLRVLSKACYYSVESNPFQNVNLRYITYCHLRNESKVLPSSISLLWNLQTLVIKTATDEPIVAPLKIWQMMQLRHLKCSRILLPDPPQSDEEDNTVVLANLQTLGLVVDFRLIKEVCKRIPNIKKLQLYNNNSNLHENLQNLGSLHKLKSLNMMFSTTSKPVSISNHVVSFPSSLNKLYLSFCDLNWDFLSVAFGSLPQLEVLKVEGNVSKDVRKCSCVEGDFLV